jgi:hypothetical protein
MYLQKLVGTVDDDALLTKLKTAVVECAIDYINRDDMPVEADLPDAVCWKLAKQVANEYQNRRSVGIVSVTSPDGSKTMLDADQWLPDVRKVLQRHRLTEF